RIYGTAILCPTVWTCNSSGGGAAARCRYASYCPGAHTTFRPPRCCNTCGCGDNPGGRTPPTVIIVCAPTAGCTSICQSRNPFGAHDNDAYLIASGHLYT